MKKNAVDPVLLQLLVSVYNQSIQTYFYFPDVIICGYQRLEREAFDQLLANEMVQPFKADSFGRWYRLSKKGEEVLLQSFSRRRHRQTAPPVGYIQHCLPFFDVC
jgi:cyclopropane fatty-acyl-phospholipid synthase-like methyltransferase